MTSLRRSPWEAIDCFACCDCCISHSLTTSPQCGSYQLPVLLKYVGLQLLVQLISGNIEHFATQISRAEALGQSLQSPAAFHG